jgi:hypothetical protein
MTIMMRLNLAADLLFVIRRAENKLKPGALAIAELFCTDLTRNPKLMRDFQESMNNLLTWLFLNAR